MKINKIASEVFLFSSTIYSEFDKILYLKLIINLKKGRNICQVL